MKEQSYKQSFKIALLKVNFFLETIDFCLNELKARILNKQSSQTQQKIQMQYEIDQLKKQDEILQNQPQQLLQISENDSEFILDHKEEKIKQKPLFTFYKPKAPTSSYLIYLHEKKSQITAKYKITNITEITKIASQDWKKLTEFQKQEYYKKSQQQKYRYKTQMQAYREKYGQEIEKQRKNKLQQRKLKLLQNKKLLKKKSNRINNEEILKKIKKKLGNKFKQNQQNLNNNDKNINLQKINQVNLPQIVKQNVNQSSELQDGSII